MIAADLFADADLAKQCDVTRVTPYPDGFEAWLAETDCDAWLYTGALENYPELVDRLANLRPLIGHASEVLRRVRDPLALQSTLNSAGLNFPETQDNAPAKPENVWVGKSYRGSCGSGVGRGGDSRYWQRIVGGVSLSAVFQGQQLLGVTRQLVGEDWTGAKPFQYCGTIAPWPLPEDKIAQLHTLGQVLRDEFQLTGLHGVDLIDDGARLWTIEVNPRYTASMEVVERAYGTSVFETMSSPPPWRGGGCSGDQALSPLPSPPHQGEGARISIESTTSACFGKLVLFAKYPLTISAELNDQLMRQAGNLPWPEIADIPNPETDVAASQPVLSLFADGGSCEAVEKNLSQRVVEIEKRLYQEAMPCG